MAGPHTARARARTRMLVDIRHRALRQLSEGGAAELSLRAIARDLGLVSSAIYRYYANRDELLTALIVEAYDDLARAVVSADADLDPQDFRERWLARCRALRAWARNEPARFQLIYGSPVPGYRAPGETVAPAGAVVLALLRVPDEAATSGASAARTRVEDPGVDHPGLRRQLGEVAGALDLALPAAPLARAVGAFAEVIGLVTLELGGHFVGAFEPADDLYEHCVAELADRMGLRPRSD